MIPHIITSLLLLAIFIFISMILVRIGRKTVSRKIKNPIVVETISKLFALPALLAGLYLVLKISGLSEAAVTLLGSTGAIGLVVGFAMQNIMSNYFAGIMLSVRKPYKVGDIVEIKGKQGIVQKMTTRGTVLVDGDGNHVIIPNSEIYGNTIVNLTANPSLRISFTVEIPHWHSIAKARKTILEALSEIPEILDKPEESVLIDQFTSYSVKLSVSFWIDARKSSLSKMKSAAMETVKTRLAENGIELAHQTLNVDMTERFVKPEEKAAPTKTGEHVYIEKIDTKSERDAMLKEARKGRDVEQGNELK
jgi:small-conductance mechanosensitive channel